MHDSYNPEKIDGVLQPAEIAVIDEEMDIGGEQDGAELEGDLRVNNEVAQPKRGKKRKPKRVAEFTVHCLRAYRIVTPAKMLSLRKLLDPC